MERTLLIVDDDANVLSSLRRQLKGKYNVHTAESGREGLEILDTHPEITVVVSDYKMPAMNGLQFLLKVKEKKHAIVRMMLTGQADFEAVINIINEGNIYRFLTKPCPPELFLKNIDDAFEQYRLTMAEKELLSKTLSGSLQVMTDLLVLAKPQAFNRGLRAKNIVKKIVEYMNPPHAWQIEIAAMLSQVGCVTIPDSVLDKIYRNLPVPAEDRAMYLLHTKTSSDIIAKIPRLEKVATIIAYQEKYFNGTGTPADQVKGKDIPLGARVLKVAMDFDQLMQIETATIESALEKMRSRGSWYDPEVLQALERVMMEKPEKHKYIVKQVMVDELTIDMYLAQEIQSASGVIIGTARQRINKTLMVTLKNYLKNREIIEPIKVLSYVD